MNAQARPPVLANGRSYAWPKAPTIVVCMDGSEPGYIEAAIAKGLAPNLDRLMRTGANLLAKSAMPSFTNPNNISIITGRPPAVHGIAGNYFYDREAKEEVMMNDVRFMRADTIMKAFHDAGASVAVVTAKDKLRTLLGKGLDCASGRAVAFSSEKADQATVEKNGVGDVLNFVGMKLPDVYSADLSEFVFAAGVKLLETRRPDLMYLSTTDFVQHKAAPGAPMADSFYAMMDRYVGRLDALGAVLVLTADHGMNDKHLPNGEPSVVFLSETLDAQFGAGTTRVILPITDPYVVHHGALGSWATIYLHGADRAAVIATIRKLDGVDEAMTAEEACARFELPADRIGDIVVISGKHVTLGTARARHDLTGLTEPLRSHGGLTEQVVPMIANRKVTPRAGHDLRNFDVFDVALNLVQS
ncbi:MAG: phosphonoacetate hydrolase [Methylobacteriaceae bacterium]|nr:phosphonoacetate hydrolase [Methylobacteriaceae bacterium]